MKFISFFILSSNGCKVHEPVLFVENQFTQLRKLRHHHHHRHVEYTLVILICITPFLVVPTHRGEETILHHLVEVWILFKKYERHKILKIGGGCNLALQGLTVLVSFLHMNFFHLLFATIFNHSRLSPPPLLPFV
jgi:hypothetical protein